MERRGKRREEAYLGGINSPTTALSRRINRRFSLRLGADESASSRYVMLQPDQVDRAGWSSQRGKRLICHKESIYVHERQSQLPPFFRRLIAPLQDNNLAEEFFGLELSPGR